MSMMSAGSGMAFDLLWKNSNPAASFNAQTISVPGMSEYEAILIGFGAKSAGASPGQYAFVDLRNSTSSGTGISYVYWGSSQGRNVEVIHGRGCTINKEKGTIAFEGCWSAERTGTMNSNNNWFAEANGANKPAYIWGLKRMPKLEGIEA